MDVGAYVGNWSKTAHRVFLEAEILAVEAQREKEKDFRGLSETIGKIQHEIALLEEKSRQNVPFRRDGSVSKVMRQVDPKNPHLERREMMTLDALTEGTAFAAPDF